MERHRRRHQRVVGVFAGEVGQATVEFAVVAVGLAAVVAALAAMWKAFGSGLLVQHALAVASHHVQAVAPATIADIFLY